MIFRLIGILLAIAATLAAQGGDDVLTLSSGTVLVRQIAGGQEHRYKLTLAAGEYAGLTVDQRGIDVVVEVRGADGKLTADFDGESRKQGVEQVGLVADSPTTFDLRVKPRYPKDPAAAYEIRVAEVREEVDRDRELYEAHKASAQALALSSAGNYDDALHMAEHALQQAEQAQGPKGIYVGYLLARLGFLNRSKGDYPNASRMFERAVAVCQAAVGRESPQTAYALGGLAMNRMDINNYAEAEKLMLEGIAITERTLGKEHARVAGELMDLSLLHQNRQDMERALPELQRALEIARKTLAPDDFQLMALTNNLGNLYLDEREYDRAEPLLESALAMIERKFGPEHPYNATPLQNIGSIARQKKQYDRALGFYERAEAIREKAMGSQHPQTASLLINIANVYTSEGQYPKALELDRQALDVLQTAAGPYHSLTLLALVNLARTYAAQGDLAKAVEYQTRYDGALERNLELNLAIGSEREKLAYISATAEHTDRTLSLCLQQAPDNQAACDLAATVVLQRKGRVLDAVSSNFSALRQRLNPDDRKLLDELSEANAKLAALSLNSRGKTSADEYAKKLAALQEEKEKLEAAISARSGEFRAQSQVVTLDAVRAAIPAGAALIEFAVYRPFDPKGEVEDRAYAESHYAAYVLRAGARARWKDLGASKQIDAEVSALREALRSPQGDVRPLARRLDEQIMRPLRGLTGDAAQLLVAPDGALNLIPFEALLDQRGKYLVERESISYLSSGRDLLRLQVKRQSKGVPVIFANPLFGEPAARISAAARRPAQSGVAGGTRRSVTTGEDLSNLYFAPLSGTEEEARAIHSYFPEATVMSGRQASKTALDEVTAPEILHIATHGFFLRDDAGAKSRVENPLLRSGLALAGANLTTNGKGGGILTALEASGLNLWGTKLVTLSACDTGVGEVKNGEGVYGLRRAFVLAGAESLLMTLWPVSDYVTREVMTAYYAGLQKGAGMSEALRQAQLAMLHRQGRNHPFYWAGFIQSGQWKSLNGK